MLLLQIIQRILASPTGLMMPPLGQDEKISQKLMQYKIMLNVFTTFLQNLSEKHNKTNTKFSESEYLFVKFLYKTAMDLKKTEQPQDSYWYSRQG